MLLASSATIHARRVATLCTVTKRCGGGLSATITIGSSHGLSSSSCTPHALSTARRTYFWPYNDDFVPKGESTSRFQSSSVPSVRQRIIREYALGPLFSERVPCCVLGFTGSARDVIGHKAALREALAVLFSASTPHEITFGPLQQTKDMLLFRPNTSESPRLGDGPRSRSDSARRRRSQYARAPVQARTVVEIYFEPVDSARTPSASSSASSLRSPSSATLTSAEEAEELEENEDESHVAATALGRLVQEALENLDAHDHMSSSSVNPSCTSSSTEAQQQQQQEQHQAAARLRELGVVYCEIPEEDVSDYVFDTLHGAPVDSDLMARVVDRWERRLQQLEDQSNEARVAATAPLPRRVEE